MKVWFLIVMFLNDPNAKVSVYETEKECKKYIPTARQEFKNRKVESISCQPGELNLESESGENYL